MQADEKTRFETAVRHFDEANALDPNLETLDGAPMARELVYSRWLEAWVLKLCPEASTELRLAARSQHLCRWMIARDKFPKTRAGYLKWREALKSFHADKAGEILRQAGYGEDVVRRVQSLIRKENFTDDPETRVMEDALCLVFLEHQLVPLADKTSEPKMVNALRKAWAKMTPTARQIALNLNYAAREKALIEKALAKGTPAGEATDSSAS